MYDGSALNVLTIDDITAAVHTVEKVHKISFDSIHKFIYENQDAVINGFSQMTAFENIDDKYRKIEQIFSLLPNFNEWVSYILEIAVLLG